MQKLNKLQLGIRALSCLLILFCFINAAVQSQGLPGTDLDPREIPGRAPIPDLIPGKDDRTRWQLVTGITPRLIGMKKKQVQKIFGKGAERRSGELSYQITKGIPKKSGQLACIELRIEFEKDAVEQFTIAALRWH